VYIKNIIIVFLLPLLVFSCDLDEEAKEYVPPPSLPFTVYGQLPTREAIIQAAEAVGAANVQIISYQMATSNSTNASGVNTNGGIQPSWWRPNVTSWGGGNNILLTAVYVFYDETDNMHPTMSVIGAIFQLFKNAGFWEAEATWNTNPFRVETTTDSRWKLIPLPTYADIIFALEQLGASNINIKVYKVYANEYYFWRQPNFDENWYYKDVPSNRSINAIRGNVYISPVSVLTLSYEYSGLGSIVSNSDVVNKIRELFCQFGFDAKSTDYTRINVTGTLKSTSFPLPSYNQIIQASEQAGADNVEIKYYIANNARVTPINEGSRLVDTPIIVEIYYDGQTIPTVETNVRALFANFTNAHIGNNAIALLPLPRGTNIRQAVIHVLYFYADSNEPSVYTVDGKQIDHFYTVYADWAARIKVFVYGDGRNNAEIAGYAVSALVRLFNERGFFNLDIGVTNR